MRLVERASGDDVRLYDTFPEEIFNTDEKSNEGSCICEPFVALPTAARHPDKNGQNLREKKKRAENHSLRV